MNRCLRLWLVLMTLAMCLNLAVCQEAEVSSSAPDNNNNNAKNDAAAANVPQQAETQQQHQQQKQDKDAAAPKSFVLSHKVIELTSENFASSVGDGNIWLIEFYTPWCRHCQNFKPVYASIAATFHSSPSEGIRIAKVDCSVEKALRARFGVSGYPSFYLVEGWSVYQFDNVRTEPNLMDFARGGYKKQDPIPFILSPMGPMGLMQGTFVYVGTGLLNSFQEFRTSYSLSPITAGMFLCAVVLFGGMISIALIAILTTPKTKHD